MAGIYIHIPFCAKKCFYCDFYVTISTKHKNEYIETLKKEIGQRKEYLNNERVETIYFGGGTPSMLHFTEINNIIEEIRKNHTISGDPEITLEANPDDLTNQYLTDLAQTEVNRLSIGIQSFFDEDLKLMNRRHDSDQSKLSVINSIKKGFNITVDLIYGLPGMTIEKWRKNLDIFFEYEIPHLSAYHLTYEPKTVFDNYLKKGKIRQITEEESLKQFELLRDLCSEKDYIHYETSNFAKEGFFSKHNSAYWQQKKYLGLGAAAHSYDGHSRQNNAANIKTYISGIFEQKEYFTKEHLTKKDKYNDYIITSLRTIWGVDINYVKKKFGEEFYDYINNEKEKYIQNGSLTENKRKIFITKSGKFIEDKIIEDLFF